MTVLIEENLALAAILFGGILTLWVPSRWALTIFQVTLFVLAAVRIVQRRSLGQHFVGWLLATTVAWGLLQVAVHSTVDQLTTLGSTLNWMTNLVAFSLALDLNRNPQQRKRFLSAALAFTALLGVVSIFTGLTSPVGRVFWRFDVSDAQTFGPFVYKNQYAAFVEAILPLAILRAIREPQKWLSYTLVAAMLFGSVIASGSRTGSALCLLEILMIPVIACIRKQIRGRALARVIAGSVAAMTLLTAVVGWQVIWNRLQEPHPYALRWQLVRSSVAMVRDRPWMGFGLGTWPAAYPGYALFDDGTFVNQAHNDWMQWAVEGGLPFLLVLLTVAAWSVRPAVQSLWGIGLCGVFLHSLIDYPMQQRPALAAFFFAMLGLLAAYYRSTSLQKSNDRPDDDTGTIPRTLQ